MLLQVSSVKKLFAAEIVLADISFKIESREKVALVGRNGTGKTTLLRILTSQYEPDAGSIKWARGANVGYLSQEHAVGAGRTIIEEAQSGIAHKIELQDRLSALELKMDAGEADEDDIEEFARLHEHFEETSGFSLEREVRSVLIRMGFTEDDFDRSTQDLSGGQKTRLALARLLLEEPDLLILDEPTNHLDLQATEWLEKWIRQYLGAVLLVSHDRTFLENTAERVMELRDGRVKSYPGDFNQYVRLRAEEDARLASDAARQAAEIAKLDEFVRRFMNSQRTAQARGRLKMMERLVANKIEAPVAEKGIRAKIGTASRSGEMVAICEKASIGYPGRELLTNFDWLVRWQERWGVVGENGTGKSTLVKSLVGKIPLLKGKARLGANVSLGYFSQDATELDEEMSPLEFMVYECGLDTAPARDVLGRYLISGDDAIRPIRTLSGGEKNKLVLASLTTAAPNLLVLDEPTNHLDMASRSALAEVLQEYEGTLILVSHDRWLLNRVTDHILDVRKAGPRTFGGSFAEYRNRNWDEEPVTSATRTTTKVAVSTPSMSAREISKEITRTENLIGHTEDEIARTEDAIKHVEENLANPAGIDVIATTEKYDRLSGELTRLLGEWEAFGLRLNELKSMQGS